MTRAIGMLGCLLVATMWTGCTQSFSVSDDEGSPSTTPEDTGEVDSDTGPSSSDTDSGEASGGTDADSDTLPPETDVSTDSDNGSDKDTDDDTETGRDARIEQCVQEYTDGCAECWGACEGGGHEMLFYPNPDGEDLSISEIYQRLVASWYCSMCDLCQSTFQIQENDAMISASVVAFCVYITEYNDSCDDCLMTYRSTFD